MSGRPGPCRERNTTASWEFDVPAFPTFDEMNVGSNTRVLVLVPHEDDGIVGCGGTICKFGKGGAHVKVVYLTGYGHSEENGRKCLVKMDTADTAVSLRYLRCFESEMIHPGVKGVRCDKKSFERVRSILHQYGPDILFVPCFDESNPDYIKAAAIAAHALDGYVYKVDCYCYAYGGVSRPNTLVDISDVIDDKIDAFRERGSEAISSEEEGNIRRMHLYRLSSSQDDRYCECFHRFPKEVYLGLARDLGLTERYHL